MRRLYSASSGEDRKHRLMAEARGRRDLKKGSTRPVVFESLEDFLDAVALAQDSTWLQEALAESRAPNPRLASRLEKGGDLYLRARSKRSS